MWLEFAPVYKNLMIFNKIFFYFSTLNSCNSKTIIDISVLFFLKHTLVVTLYDDIKFLKRVLKINSVEWNTQTDTHTHTHTLSFIYID